MPKGDYPPCPLETAQALALIAAPNVRSRSGLRDRTLLAVLYRTGMRSNEARSLEVQDIVREPNRALRIRWPKGLARKGHAEHVGLDAKTYGWIMEWLEVRGFGPGPLFNTASGGKIESRNMRSMVKRRAERAGIVQRVHPHCLRHTFARELYDAGMGLKHIQAALRHSQLATTAVYLSHIGCDEAIAMTAEREW